MRMLSRIGRQGQATLEYAVIIAVVIAALLAMQVYMKRGIQGKLRESTDQVGEQFSPTAYKATFVHTQESHAKETLHVGTQAAGESTSVTQGVGIKQTRTSTADEQLTDAQASEKLF